MVQGREMSSGVESKGMTYRGSYITLSSRMDIPVHQDGRVDVLPFCKDCPCQACTPHLVVHTWYRVERLLRGDGWPSSGVDRL